MFIIEANEVPEDVFKWYASISKGSISSFIEKEQIANTVTDDVSEKYLYPSQAWASISTSQSADKHKIRWYNDAKSNSPFYWRELAKKGKNVLLMGVLHSGSITEKEMLNYDFVFPDFFHLEPKVSKSNYLPFQKFNYEISVLSGRKTSLKVVFMQALKSFIKYPILKFWGVSLKDILVLLNLMIKSIKDPEMLRNIQFLLQARIFLNESKVGLGKDLSVLFTNHIAATLHRNFTDLSQVSKENENKKNKIKYSMFLLDRFLNELESLNKNREIIILTALGQKKNDKITRKYKSSNQLDYKIIDKDKFINFFIGQNNNVDFLPEMIPQYSFYFHRKEDRKLFLSKLQKIGSDPNSIRFGYYVPSGKKNTKTDGFFMHIDQRDEVITCTTSIRPNKEGFIKMNNKKIHFEKLGFGEFKVKDFHNGEHSKFGCLISSKNKPKKSKFHFSEVSNLIKKNIS